MKEIQIKEEKTKDQQKKKEKKNTQNELDCER